MESVDSLADNAQQIFPLHELNTHVEVKVFAVFSSGVMWLKWFFYFMRTS